MRKSKSQLLNEANDKAMIYTREQRIFRNGPRKELIEKVRECEKAHCTQQEIADAVGLSRQRVAQLLKART